MFRKLEPNTSWSTGSHAAWSVITNDTLELAETQAHLIAHSFLNSVVQQWTSALEKASGLRGRKDDDGNIII